MKLFLVQHGKAKDKDEDPQRPLTDQGRAETEKIAELLARIVPDIGEIRHSGKTRAEQTAVIFGRALGLAENVVQKDYLGATEDVTAVAEQLQSEGQSVMLVGHKPFMPRMAGWLVNGDIDNSPVSIQKSGVLCLNHHNDNWQVEWHLTPN